MSEANSPEYIRPSEEFAMLTADDLSVILQSDLSTINFYQEFHITEPVKRGGEAMRYRSSHKLLRLAVRIPTQKLLPLRDLLAKGEAYLAGEHKQGRFFLYATSAVEEHAIKTIEAGNRESTRLTQRVGKYQTEIHIDVNKDTVMAHEAFEVEGQVVDEETTKGVPDAFVWIAFAGQVGTEKTNEHGQFKHVFKAPSQSGIYETRAFCAQREVESRNISIRVEKV